MLRESLAPTEKVRIHGVMKWKFDVFIIAKVFTMLSLLPSHDGIF